jgi:hypothetical protein
MLPYFFVLLAIAVRFLPFAGPLNVLPHAWHFTPVAASLLFFGARGKQRQMWIPLLMLAATDVVLTKLIYGLSVTWDHLVTFGWYGAILWLGTNLRETNLREKSGALHVIAAALASSVSFFLISNFAVWAAWPANVSPQLERLDDVVHSRPAIFPRHAGKRFVLLGGHVRHTRLPACPLRLVQPCGWRPRSLRLAIAPWRDRAIENLVLG